MAIYDDDFIEKIKDWDKRLDDDWYHKLDKMPDHEAVDKMKEYILYMQCTIRVLISVAGVEMSQTNKIYKILDMVIVNLLPPTNSE